MKSDVCFTNACTWKVIVDEIIHITRIRFLAFDDYRLVLLISSTIELPKLILWQLILYFLCTACTAWAQKERARECSLTVSFSFCELNCYWKIWYYNTYILVCAYSLFWFAIWLVQHHQSNKLVKRHCLIITSIESEVILIQIPLDIFWQYMSVRSE